MGSHSAGIGAVEEAGLVSSGSGQEWVRSVKSLFPGFAGALADGATGMDGFERRVRWGSVRARELVSFLRCRGKNGFVR